MKNIIDRAIAMIFLTIAIILIINAEWQSTWIGILIAIIGFGLHLYWSFAEEKLEYGSGEFIRDEKINASQTTLTELILLGEDGTRIASWNIYGKNGLVIGRDIRENHVSINLENATYASMIDIEHAVLNYSGDSWYIEDVSEKNGVSVEKMDGKKYKLSYGKPCKLDKGDIIYIALTRLQIL